MSQETGGTGDQAELLARRAAELRIDAATAEVMAAFTQAGIDGRLIKGRALVDWLYDDFTRTYLDADLLVHPAQVEPACGVLAKLGFERQSDQRSMPDWWRGHDIQWLRRADQVTVDLHTRIDGVGLDPVEAWSLLTAGGDLVSVAGHQLPTLGEPARAMHLALHVCQHGTHGPKPILDLERGLARLDQPVWREAAALAARLQASDSFATGLRFTPDGAALATDLGLPKVPASIRVAVLSGVRPPGAITVERLLATGGWRRRATGAWRVIFPPADYMRSQDPDGTRGVLRLAVAYIRRAIWVARSAPASVRSYRAARRRVTAGRSDD